MNFKEWYDNKKYKYKRYGDKMDGDGSEVFLTGTDMLAAYEAGYRQAMYDQQRKKYKDKAQAEQEERTALYGSASDEDKLSDF